MARIKDSHFSSLDGQHNTAAATSCLPATGWAGLR